MPRKKDKNKKHLKQKNACILYKNKVKYNKNKEQLNQEREITLKARSYAFEETRIKHDTKLGFMVNFSETEANRMHPTRKKDEKRKEKDLQDLSKSVKTKTRTIVKSKRYNVYSLT